MLKRIDWTTVIFTALIIVLGIVCYKLYNTTKELEEKRLQEINLLDEKLRQNESIIDSLENKISLRESIIDSLSFSRQEVIIEKKIVIEEVKTLPVTDAVEFLNEKLKVYEKIFEIDSLSNSDDILIWEY